MVGGIIVCQCTTLICSNPKQLEGNEFVEHDMYESCQNSVVNSFYQLVTPFLDS